MNAQSVIKRVDSVLKRVGGMDKPLYLRTYVQDANSDALTGRDTGEYTDTLLSPPPAYTQLSTRDVMFLTANGKKVTAEDYKITLSVNSITEAQVQDPNTQFVIKDESESSEEVLRIVYDNANGFQGLSVVWSVIARSVGNSS